MGMTTKFYVDRAGKYLGGYDGAEPPSGAVEVPSAPSDARQVWDGSSWGDVPASVKHISKNAIWERASDEEAETMDGLLRQQTIRLRRIYEGATHISTDHELYDVLNAALVQAFGETRANELLAPTN